MPDDARSMDSQPRSSSTDAPFSSTPDTSDRKSRRTGGANPGAPSIPDDTVGRYHYVYDSRQGRTVVHDRQTRAPYDWSADPRTPLLKDLARRITARSVSSPRAPGRPKQMYRRFALWCASAALGGNLRNEDAAGQDATSGDSASAALFRAARSLDALTSDPEISETEVSAREANSREANSREADSANAVRQRYEHEVIHAATVGLSEMDPGAARLLTVHCATDPDARRAAFEAGHMCERYAEFVAYQRHAYQRHADTDGRAARAIDEPDLTSGSKPSTPYAADEPPSPDAAARLMREAQINWCLDRQLDLNDK